MPGSEPEYLPNRALPNSLRLTSTPLSAELVKSQSLYDPPDKSELSRDELCTCMNWWRWCLGEVVKIGIRLGLQEIGLF